MECDKKGTDPALPSWNPDLLNIRLTEIHYHPLDLDAIDSDSLEFIEIKNVGPTELDVSSLAFTAGVDYAFPADSKLSPGAFYVVASNKSGFERRYGASPDGVYSGQLKNSGENIKLIERNTLNPLISQEYGDSGDWPKEADDGGYSLVPVNLIPGADETAARFWRASSRVHGSPGKDDESRSFDSSLFALRLTEIHYHPEYVDTLGDDSLEFIELKNVGSKALDLSGLAFASGIDYTFTDAKLQPGAFFVLASNGKWFQDRYGSAPSGVFDGQLKNSGEDVILQDIKAGITVISVSYADDKPWPSNADGGGKSVVTVNANPSRAEQNTPAAWRESFRMHGSPGADDPSVVFVNEVLTHTDPPALDAVELYNPGGAAVDISGWYLTDSRVNPVKYRIPIGTLIPANGYLVFDAGDFNADTSDPASFGLSEGGEEAYLMADSTGCRGFCHGCSFGALENGVTYGRHITSTGNEVFVPMKSATLGAANSGPMVGPLVISEIMFYSADNKSDFIEVSNITSRDVPLFDSKNPKNTWKIPEIGFIFPENCSLKAGKSAVIASNATAVDAFRNAYSLAGDVQIFSFTGSLPDSSQKLELEKPMEPDPQDSAAVPDIDYMEMDKVSYRNGLPWPVGASGTGASLQRIKTGEFGNDPANWKVAQPTPGRN
jgi:hypothetical protein